MTVISDRAGEWQDVRLQTLPQIYPYELCRCDRPCPTANADINLLASRQVTWMDLAKPVGKPLINETRLPGVSAAKSWIKIPGRGSYRFDRFCGKRRADLGYSRRYLADFVSGVGTDLGPVPILSTISTGIWSVCRLTKSPKSTTESML